MSHCIPYKDIPYYSDLILDYLSENKKLKSTYNRFPKLENFKAQLQEKSDNFPNGHREKLSAALEKQYHGLEPSKSTAENIALLRDQKTFTITTGHQLNIFTGPLYFFYKIISVINLTKELKTAYPDYNFVPIYWLASEDHDFEEISFFNYKNKKHTWKTDQKGAVGRFSTKGLEKVFEEFKAELNCSDHANYLRDLFEAAYLKHDNLTDATRYLANEFFRKEGLVIIDGDDVELKTLFAPHVKTELLQQHIYQKVGETAEFLKTSGYNIQVNPREINLFYLGENSRDRIVKKEDYYFLNETEQNFSEQEILEILETHPERFSPNAIMRPLYQEVVLPNLCYIGGSGELAYWLELKSYFEGEKVTFPMLLMRNSALLMSKKQENKLDKLNLSKEDLFLKQFELLEKKTKALSDIDINFKPQVDHLKKQFSDLYNLAEKTDKSFIGAVAAQEKKQINGLEYLEKRLLKAQKKALENKLKRTKLLQNELFPQGNLQERVMNFSEFYEIYGDEFLKIIQEELKPLELKFDVIKL